MPTLKFFEHSVRAMGSACCVSFYCQQSGKAAQFCRAFDAELIRLEHKYSRFREDSFLSSLNASAGVSSTPLDEETWQLLQYADTAYQQSDGRFDITAGNLSRLWDFRRAQVPDEPTLAAALALTGWSRVSLEKHAFKLPTKGMQLDLGGIVKEYAADAVAYLAVKMGIGHGLIDLAGDMRVIGPHPDGRAWQVGISHPDDPNRAIATIPMTQGGLASSGNYARCFEWQGKRYSHLIDPTSGWPVEGLQAVSVWAPQCVVAGSIATIAMLKPEPQGLNWLASLGVSYVCMNNEGHVIQSTDKAGADR